MSPVTDRYAALPITPPKPVCVAMVEDDCACRLAVMQAVQGAQGMQMLWAAASRQEALTKIQGGSDPSPDVLLVDLGLPDGSGLDVIATARASWPDCAVMVSTIFGDETHVLRAIEAGAMGYLLKDLSAEELVSEIRSLHAGGSPINPMVARKLLLRQAAQAARSPQVPAQETAVPPSAREAEVLRLVARGYTVDEVAGALGVSPHTVQTFVRRIYTKLQVNSRAGAVREGARQGWLREE
ncbi:response regulator transcription factor [Pigmentiphaga aceris]|uniref:Response regulator transcription factor n=1 Tax=Pigmentiphaga aceris TaxID=1940612 RepID=A0A5C0B138_9BURK|nr:response regulator transcription factor [Pigmentiphaga aceris]QEI08449.1 response regulator transcription factor [Pigmentiphaga aceris]